MNKKAQPKLSSGPVSCFIQPRFAAKKNLPGVVSGREDLAPGNPCVASLIFTRVLDW